MESHFVCDFVFEKDIDVLFLTETWLPAEGTVVTGELTPPGYTFINVSRSATIDPGHHGGIVTVRTFRHRRHPQWYNEDISSARRERRRAERRWLKVKSPENFRSYHDAKDKVKKALLTAKSEYFKEKISDCTPKSAFGIINSLLNRKDIVLPAHDSPVDVSNQFASFFADKVKDISCDLSNQCSNLVLNPMYADQQTQHEFDFSELLLIAIFFLIHGLKSVIHSGSNPSTTAFLSLCVSVLTVALIPIDIFLVSSMKDSNGTFEDWAADNVTRSNIQQYMQYSYYALYCCNAVLIFFVIPFVMCFYKGDEDSTGSERCCTAIYKYTPCYVVVAGVLLLVRAFVPWQGIPDADEFLNGKGFDALCFLLGSIALLGMFGIIGYTGIGMAAIPISMIKGTQCMKSEPDEIDSAIQDIQRRKNAVERRYHGNGRFMSSRHQFRRLQEFDDEEQLIERRERHFESTEKSLAAKGGKFWRPFQVVAGLLFLMLSFLLITSLFITSLDRALHSLGPRSGYVLRQRRFPNLVEIILLYAQQ
ncbi:probable lysosomal cobalamin transporter, partial [Diadema setosum]|uniref:probable lysosomal cobalamin transporter n=1 Tax=Diadema setosum TaxID=31175 RepID=UPI003B3B0583